MNAVLSNAPNTLVLPLLNGQTSRLSPTGTGVIGEPFVGSNCVTLARFQNFAAAGQRADSVIRRAAAPPALTNLEDYAP